MLSLELWTKNSQGERTYQGTYRRTWKTMRGLENFRQKVVNDRNDEHCGLSLSGSASERLEPFSYL